MEGVRCAIRRNSLRVAREDGLERRVEGFRCAIVLEVGIEAPGFILLGDWASGIPCKQGFDLQHSPAGIGPTAFPPLSGFGFIAFSIPHSAAAGALAQQQKKAQEGPSEALLFFVHCHPLCKQACNGLPVYKKSPQALLESFFLLLCGERGIRTPGTVTRTSV